jgi:GDP-mannose 6-dehydrogenase
LIAGMVAAGRLRATMSCQEAVDASDIAFICVGTPGDRHGQLQLDALQNVCHEIGLALRGAERPFTVVVRSTVLPGTTSELVQSALMKGAGKDFRPWLRVAMNPEFIREGCALKDFANPAFTLVGCEDFDTAMLLEAVYGMVPAPFIYTQLKTAETVKYVSNAWHALKVCFANEIGDACEALGSDPQEVMRIFALDDKLNISKAYLKPGFAFGGSCLPKDVKALLYALQHANVVTPVLANIIGSNDLQISNAVSAVLATGKKRIGVLGLAFKPDTDDLRKSPMVTLVEMLIGKGCNVRILDRNVAVAKLVGANRQYINEEIPHVSQLMCADVKALLDHSEVLVLGNADSDALQILDQAGPTQIVVDLSRGMLQPAPGLRRQAA